MGLLFRAPRSGKKEQRQCCQQKYKDRKNESQITIDGNKMKLSISKKIMKHKSCQLITNYNFENVFN